MSKKTNLYLGKAGQMAVMSEILCRGWNVSVPEVDVGDDIFVVKDDSGDFIRVQVKTASGKSASASEKNIRAQFSVNKRQLGTLVQPYLLYAFVIRFEHKWVNYILIGRDDLLTQVVTYHHPSPELSFRSETKETTQHPLPQNRPFLATFR